MSRENDDAVSCSGVFEPKDLEMDMEEIGKQQERKIM